MFDYHMHSSLSFDSDASALKMAQKAAQVGLKEICFTDHYDYFNDPLIKPNLFNLQDYSNAYDNLSVEGIKIKKGVEFGLIDWNSPQLEELLDKRNFDFVIGSVHYVGGQDPYNKEYWQDKTVKQAFEIYLKGIYNCVKVHKDFDVLGHLTYVCKSKFNPTHKPVAFKDFSDITDEIMKILITKGIGLEVNTSGVDSAGVFLPDREFLVRFKELGGEIVTVGTDSHNEQRIGQYVPEALEMIKDIFGYVCTFENRKPIFNKL